MSVMKGAKDRGLYNLKQKAIKKKNPNSKT